MFALRRGVGTEEESVKQWSRQIHRQNPEARPKSPIDEHGVSHLCVVVVGVPLVLAVLPLLLPLRRRLLRRRLQIVEMLETIGMMFCKSIPPSNKEEV